MEVFFDRTKKIIALIIVAIIISFGSSQVFATTKYYPEKDGIKKGSQLLFTGNSWFVYPSKEEARAAAKDNNGAKHCSKIIYKNTRIVVREVSDYILKIGTDSYIIYGKTGSKYFKQEKIYTADIKKGDKLKFTGNGWYVYPTTEKALQLDHNSSKELLRKNDIIEVKGKAGNVLKIDDNKYIYYGGNANKYFEKIKCTEPLPIAKDPVEAVLEALGLDSATIQKIMKVVNDLSEADKQKLIENMSKLTDEQKAQLASDLKKLDEKEIENYIEVIVNIDEITDAIGETLNSIIKKMMK